MKQLQTKGNLDYGYDHEYDYDDDHDYACDFDYGYEYCIFCVT